MASEDYDDKSPWLICDGKEVESVEAYRTVLARACQDTRSPKITDDND